MKAESHTAAQTLAQTVSQTPAQSHATTAAAANPLPRRVTVCADDFGIEPAVSTAILELLAARRIRATSVLVGGSATAEYATELERLRAHDVSIGLHFTLTEAVPGHAPSALPALILRSHLHLLRPKTIRSILLCQLQRFEKLFDQPPQFVDGHEHVHQFPVIRTAFLQTLAQRYGHSVAVRSTRTLQPRGFKAKVIEGLGGSGMHSLAVQQGFYTNSDFAGVYDLQPGNYRERMLGWLDNIADDGLIMCHPGLPGGTCDGAPARAEEYGYLRSSQWLEDLRRHRVELTPFAATPPATATSLLCRSSKAAQTAH